MPLPLEAEGKLEEFAEASEGFALFGIMLNPATGEMGTYSSHGIAPGAVLGFLQRAVNQMLDAAASGELEYIGGEDATSLQPQGITPAPQRNATGGKIGLVH